MSTLVAYIAVFIGAGIFGIAGGIPLNPLQILWLNMVIDIPIAIALGFDEPTAGLMSRRPRGISEPVINAAGWLRLCVHGLVMTVGALIAYQLGAPEGAVVASTMLLTALSLSHLAAGVIARDQRNTIFDRASLPGATQLRRYGFSLLAIVAVTTIGVLERIVGTTDLSGRQWAICSLIAASLIVVDELIKVGVRQRERRTGAVASSLTLAPR
jgi:Ca2+-transporting ATPase